jgi:hypothetical protein
VDALPTLSELILHPQCGPHVDDFRSILVHLDSSSAAADRLLVARLLAQRHKAELTGLYAVSSIGDEFVFAVAGDTASLLRLRQSEEDKCASARAQFHGVTAGLQPRTSWDELALQPDQGSPDEFGLPTCWSWVNSSREARPGMA